MRGLPNIPRDGSLTSSAIIRGIAASTGAQRQTCHSRLNRIPIRNTTTSSRPARSAVRRPSSTLAMISPSSNVNVVHIITDGCEHRQHLWQNSAHDGHLPPRRAAPGDPGRRRRGGRRSGPQGVQVRALAKTVGVSPAAVYRHVPSIDALLAEVAQVVRERLAVRLTEERDRTPTRRTRKATALDRFGCIGRGYVEFALAEPHLFDTAFTPTTGCTTRPDDPSPWEVLMNGIRELVDAGVVPPDQADRAALIAWAGRARDLLGSWCVRPQSGRSTAVRRSTAPSST